MRLSAECIESTAQVMDHEPAAINGDVVGDNSFDHLENVNAIDGDQATATEATAAAEAVGVAGETPAPTKFEQHVEKVIKKSSADRSYMEMVRAASDDLATASLRMVHARDEYKAAKKAQEAALDTLERIVRKGPEELPLFDATGAGAEADGEADAAPAELPHADGNAWKWVGIDSLGLPPKLQERLVVHGIDTMGQLEDLRAGEGLRSLKGIGAAKADAIEDAVIKWLSEFRDMGVLAAARDGTSSVASEAPADA